MWLKRISDQIKKFKTTSASSSSGDEDGVEPTMTDVMSTEKMRDSQISYVCQLYLKVNLVEQKFV